MIEHKNPWEKKNGVKFSKRGLIEFIEKFVEHESSANQKEWEQKGNFPGLKYFLKKGGSDVNTNQPFFRSDITLPKVFKMSKVAKIVS